MSVTHCIFVFGKQVSAELKDAVICAFGLVTEKKPIVTLHLHSIITYDAVNV